MLPVQTKQMCRSSDTVHFLRLFETTGGTRTRRGVTMGRKGAALAGGALGAAGGWIAGRASAASTPKPTSPAAAVGGRPTAASSKPAGTASPSAAGIGGSASAAGTAR